MSKEHKFAAYGSYCTKVTLYRKLSVALAIVDKVLAYRPKPTSRPAKKRQRTRKRLAKDRL